MRKPIIIMIAMLSVAPSFTFFNAPTEEAKTIEKELLAAQMKRADFLEAHGYPLDPNSENYSSLSEELQALDDEVSQKQKTFDENLQELYPTDSNPGLESKNEPTAEVTSAEHMETTEPVENNIAPTQPQKEVLQPEQQLPVTPESLLTEEPALPVAQPQEEPAQLPVTPESLLTEEPALPATQEFTAPIAQPTVAAIPAEPMPVKDEPVAIPEEEPSELDKAIGIDTISLENPQGNWLFKRIWWERAEERYEKIRGLVDAVWEFRTKFFVQRNELDRNVLAPFYRNIGVEQGELQIILSELIDFFEKKREQQGDLNEQERMLFDTIALNEAGLKQLQLDIDAIANLDQEIDKALGTLMNQINRIRQFENQAWSSFREIAHILDDTKARELYYVIEGAARNIKNISNYLEREFFNHFATLINEATKHVTKVQSEIEALKEKGVNFKRQTELLAQKEQISSDEEEEEEVAPKPKLSWFGWIVSGFTHAFNFVFSFIRIPYDMIFGK